MIRISSSEILIICSAVVSYANLSFSIAFLVLGVLGAIGRFASEHAEKQTRITAGENTADNISTIVSSFVDKMNKENFH